MKLDEELLKRLLATFTIELQEQNQIITDGLLQLEEGKSEDTTATLDNMFRAAHNVKGAARGIDLRDVAAIAHQLESLLGLFRSLGSIPSELVDICLKAIDMMAAATEAHLEGTPLAEESVEALTLQLKEAIQLTQNNIDNPSTQPATGSSGPNSDNITTAGSDGDDETETENTLTQEQKEGSTTAPTTPEPSATATPAAQAESSPPVDKARKRPMENEFIQITLDKLHKIDALSEELQVAKIAMETHLEMVARLRGQLQTFSSAWANAMPSLHRMEKEQLPVELLQLFEEGNDAIASFTSLSMGMYKNLRASRNQLGVLSNALQSNVRMMRLVPASTLLKPMVRSVRDIARELEKKVLVEIIGDDIEVDRVILDGVKAPLNHLLRNAIDHGIESPADRLEAGKEETGKLSIEVRNQGSEILLIINDDGGGVDVDKVRQSALSKGIVSEQELEQLSESEVIELIFRPGFSSRDIITDVSGRGVGLDVVKSALRQLKGEVHLETRRGQGSCFTLRLPLTLATEHGLLVRINDMHFAIPTTSVVRVMEVERDQIVEVEASHALLYEGRAVPLRSLSTVLNMPEPDLQEQSLLPLVLVSKGWELVALLVEEVIGEREMIIKPLQPPLVSVANVSGGAFMGSGEIVMVLNPSDLVDSSLHNGSNPNLAEARDIHSLERKLRLLVVDDSITTRTLEQNILENAGFEVKVAVDGKQAWDLVQQELFDLVVSDIEMPIMTGFELTSQIKQSEKYKHIPVILVSSLSKEEHKLKGIEAGADAYIVKGQFETKSLLDVVNRLLTMQLAEAS